MSETITVEQDVDTVRCDGGHGAAGHPAVYFSFDGANSVDCPYCGRQFVKAKAA